ncbi:MAG: helix-turn-helix domain-containing protein [Chloroflexi bacterium]|nr:helix-turn-helix domain-containing protein [Chloroflexota bacterium]
MKAKEVAEELDVCHAYVLQLLRAKKITAKKSDNGRFWEFDPESVQAYKRERRQPSDFLNRRELVA